MARGSFAAATALGMIAAATGADAGTTRQVTFTVSIESVSADDTLRLADGSGTRALLAPGAYAVHRGASPLFQPSSLASPALERLAEDGDTAPMVTLLDRVAAGSGHGMFLHDSPFEIVAVPGDRLSFAEMFVHSNDSFYGFEGGFIELFDAAGRPRQGDLTAHVVLYDAGTEIDEAPGTGPNQAPRQAKPDTGKAERHPVRPVANGFTYPPVAEVIRVTITARNDSSTS